MLSLHAEAVAVTVEPIGRVRPKCRSMGGYHAVGQIRSAIAADRGRKRASWRCSEFASRNALSLRARQVAVDLGSVG